MIQMEKKKPDYAKYHFPEHLEATETSESAEGISRHFKENDTLQVLSTRGFLLWI